MKNMTKRGFIIGLVIGVFALATCSVQAAKVKTEDELIAMLASAKEKEVINAMQQMEKHYPTSTKCRCRRSKTFLTDPRDASPPQSGAGARRPARRRG